MSISSPSVIRAVLVVTLLVGLARMAPAQNSSAANSLATGSNAPGAGAGAAASIGVVEWLRRMHSASRQRNYVGNFVVSAATGDMASARIWHVCEGDTQFERIEALSGPPRSTFRRNDHVMTFLPDSRVVKVEKRQLLELFPNLMGAPESSIAELYEARLVGKDRVAGFEADVVELSAKDSLRFGYRIWSERKSGLVVKLQTVDGDKRVIEQSAFSELQLDPPIKSQALAQMMASTAGYRVEKSELEHTSALSEGWALEPAVVGFKPVSCLKRAMAPAAGEGGSAAPNAHMMQWTFSDGLASVSLFVEPFSARGQQREAIMTSGATYTMTRRISGKGGDWWLTAVGEVPPQTLEAFWRSLVRRP
ncbi:Sigma E regulatory protein, MucB/RseB [Burkholderiales bacterium 8X]|nr:Sigma E regulatory protein, MucB/RseB [Burkholderiales bacterium 8X]